MGPGVSTSRGSEGVSPGDRWPKRQEGYGSDGRRLFAGNFDRGKGKNRREAESWSREERKFKEKIEEIGKQHLFCCILQVMPKHHMLSIASVVFITELVVD